MGNRKVLLEWIQRKGRNVMKLKKHIFLIGFMGVGKTSTSRLLSRQSGRLVLFPVAAGWRCAVKM